MNHNDLKAAVRDFWDESSCGEVYAVGETEREKYDTHSQARYALEPYILDFARFAEGTNQDVLEIGVGMGGDHVEWARAKPRSISGIDLTPRAVEHTHQRLATYGLTSDVRIGDAEKLPFEDNAFDIVYSWGVLHHSPDTPQAIREVYRVLRPGGIARIMIYHKYSFTGYMLWSRYALMAGHFTKSLDEMYWNHMESPGTKAYSVQQAQQMFASFRTVDVRSLLSFSDLLQGAVGQRHQGLLLTVAKCLWPRPLIRTLFKNHGLMLLIEAGK